MFTFTQDRVNKLRKWGNVTPNNIIFEDELTSINGCTFYLIKEKNVTNKMIAEAKRWIRSNRDVVKFHIAYIEE